MFMRFVHAKAKPDTFPAIASIYEKQIIPRLQQTPGCVCAHLAVNDEHSDEGVSMTLWETKEHAEEYEKSGVFSELLGKVRLYLSDSSEWKIQLSQDMELEYQPVPEEPVVKSYAMTASTDETCDQRTGSGSMYLRVVTGKIRPGKMGKLRRVYAQEIVPALLTVKGCRFAYLTERVEEEDEAISVTVWDNKRDADTYEASGLFTELLEKIKDTFSELYQWKMDLGGEYGGKVATSEDLAVESYRMVTGKRFL